MTCTKKEGKEEFEIVIEQDQKTYKFTKAVMTMTFEKELYKEYFSRLSLVLRTYIEDRFEIRAPELTTEEFLAVLRQDPKFSYEQREMLRSFLGECDMIKFAKGETSAELAKEATDNIKNFIEQTKETTEQKEEGGKQ